MHSSPQLLPHLLSPGKASQPYPSEPSGWSAPCAFALGSSWLCSHSSVGTETNMALSVPSRVDESPDDSCFDMRYCFKDRSDVTDMLNPMEIPPWNQDPENLNSIPNVSIDKPCDYELGVSSL